MIIGPGQVIIKNGLPDAQHISFLIFYGQFWLRKPTEQYCRNLFLAIPIAFISPMKHILRSHAVTPEKSLFHWTQTLLNTEGTKRVLKCNFIQVVSKYAVDKTREKCA